MSYLSRAAILTNQLDANRSKDVKEVIEKDDQRVNKLRIEDKALKEGDMIPDFNLKNAVGEWKNIYEILDDGPIILSFYRGAWCPYCNIELAAYQELLPEIKEMGANLIAVSPELPDESMSLIEKHSLDYEVLSDLSNKVAEQFGLVFGISDKINEFYKMAGIDIDKAQGNSDKRLPVPATYVINEDGRILLSYVDSNFRNRLEPEEAIEVLRTQTY